MNKPQSRRAALLGVLLSTALLGACASPAQIQANESIATSTQQAMEHKLPPSAPLISITAGKWLLGHAVRVQSREPDWLRQSITLNATTPMTLQEIAASIGTSSGVSVQIDPTAHAVLRASSSGPAAGAGEHERRVMVGYSGNLSGLLDRVAASYGLYWRVAQGGVVFFAQETRAFPVPALPISFTNTGTITTSTGSTASGATTSGSSTSGSSGTPTTTGTGTISQSDTLNVNTWAGLQGTAQAVAGPGSTVVADPSNALLVVTGTPTQIERVQSWVDSIAKSMVQRVAIDVQVFDVTAKQENQTGFNPSILFKDLGRRYGFSLSGVAAPTPTSGISPMTLGASIISPVANGGSQTIPGFGPTVQSANGPVYLPNHGFTGTQAIIQALATVGKVSTVVSRSLVTLNGQPATLQSATQTGYLASSSAVAAVNAGVTQSAQPGSVTTGFTAILTPRVERGDILIGMDMTLSTLLGITTQTSGATQIQTPSVAISGFSQIAALKPGQTLMLTGFRQSGAQSSQNGVGRADFQALGGGSDASTNEHHLVILVTARLVH